VQVSSSTQLIGLSYEDFVGDGEIAFKLSIAQSIPNVKASDVNITKITKVYAVKSAHNLRYRVSRALQSLNATGIEVDWTLSVIMELIGCSSPAAAASKIFTDFQAAVNSSSFVAVLMTVNPTVYKNVQSVSNAFSPNIISRVCT
jgi:hypothetical protein